ncbi:MAG TPA: cupredoxin domain-containing protein [bacterium]|jgi:plastocyanin|nr:cupredoxin domain-containing protein [bacterium]
MQRYVLIAAAISALLAAAGTGSQVHAQGTRKVISITAVSYKFTPNLITVNRGDTVVIQFSNDDTDRRFAHSFAARWLVNAQVTARGTFRTGVADERRFFAADFGQKFEIEFVADQAGSFPFVCGIFNHGALGQTGALNVVVGSQ